MREAKITNKEVLELLKIEPVSFPKYATQIINLANQNAQGTRPSVVGQMSELIQQFKGRNVDEWQEWYIKRYPAAMENAKTRILEMIQNFKNAIGEIDAKMVETWVKDLIIVKTFVGLKSQEAILKKVAQCMNKSYHSSTPEEEAKGIDGYIGEIPVSIKPISYQTKKMLQENIEVGIIYYEKTKSGIAITFDEM